MGINSTGVIKSFNFTYFPIYCIENIIPTCMKSKSIFLIHLSLIISLNSCTENRTLLDYGGVPDGKTLNTDLLQQTIDRLSKEGGGTLVIPAGKFLTGSLILKSGVSLQLEKGAILLGSRDSVDYLSIKPDFVALRTGQATKQLIFAEGQKDIAITGEGTIDGQGDAFKPAKNNDEPGITRPHLIQLINCENVRIEGITMLNSGGWMQHYLACKNLQIKNINVYNHCNYNNDGIDIDGCQDVVVSGCIVDSDDDGICLKSTSPAVCRDVVISDCVVKSHCNALKMGTESTGGFRNIAITNCVISPSADKDPIYGQPEGQSAISVEMVDGGVLDGLSISNISISETGCPIFIRLGNRARKYSADAEEPGLGTLQNVILSNIIATTSSKTTSNITGIEGGFADNIILSDIIINNLSNGSRKESEMKVPERDEAYPTAAMFGEVLPASGFFVRHVKYISFNNVQVHLKGDNVRPVYVLNDVKDAVISNPQVTSSDRQVDLLVRDEYSEEVYIRE